MPKDTRKKTIPSKEKISPIPAHLEQINQWAAGIDVGASAHFVAVPAGCDDTPVREFKTFTTDLYALADWLEQCGVKTVAMESTGVYWIPVYEILEEKGFKVNLVDARQTKNVSGRKTDVLDCQWIQQLHTFGLLNAAFRPTEEICTLRSYVRQRTMLIESACMQIQRMQKALSQMNLQLHQVISDITGVTGMKIIRAMVAGNQDAKHLASYRDHRCKQTQETIERALTGHYREEHLFALQQSLELYDIYQEKLLACDQRIEKKLSDLSDGTPIEKPSLSSRRSKKQESKNAPAFDLGMQMKRLTGINLIEIPGVNSLTVLSLIGEIGLDMTRWKSSKQFASWLGLCPGNKVSGGKRLGGKSKPSANRAAATLRMSASTLYRSQSALGAYLRRLKSRLGPAKAITATAHKIAKIIYNMLRYQLEYKETGQDYYEQQYRDRVVRNLKRKAESLGYNLVETI